MAKVKKKKSKIRFLLTPFTSSVSRFIIVIIALLIASAGVLLMDAENGLSRTIFGFLKENFVLKAFDYLGIERIDLMFGAWLLFLGVATVIFILALLDLVRSQAVKKREKHFGINLACTILGILAIVGFIVLVFFIEKLDASLNFRGNTFSFFVIVKHGAFMLAVGFAVALLIPLTMLAIYIVLMAIYIAFLIVKLVAYIIIRICIYFKNLAKDADTKVKRKRGEAEEENADFSAKKIFPALVKIDAAGEAKKTSSTSITLEEMALQFQSFAANEHKIYYGLPLIRSFLAGLATSRLMILEGLSGTGKSMMPRMFSEFTGSKAFFAPVQATWRDKTDVLGFYSEFAKTFKTTQFLENLYEASYFDKANLMVLDEMNLSRVEYYFADFLSVMEYPSEDWKIRVCEVQAGQTLPAKLTAGCVSVPVNTWFIGTANTDDSTFTITDKVYDRAIVIDFEEKTSPIVTDYKKDTIKISAEKLTELFEVAKNDERKKLTAEDTEKFLSVCEFVKESFDVAFGNRIMTQIENFVPVYVALGGTKEEALDFMFARKILRKVEGMFEDFVKEELIKLSNLLTKLYGKGVFAETEKLIAKFTKRLV